MIYWWRVWASLEKPRAVIGSAVSVGPVSAFRIEKIIHTWVDTHAATTWRDSAVIGVLDDDRYFAIVTETSYTGDCCWTTSVMLASTYEEIMQFGVTEQIRKDLGL